MKLTDAVNMLKQAKGQHLDQIYIPSAQKTLMFNPLSTSDIKTLTRISFLEEFDLNVELIKLALFDKLCVDDLSETGIVIDETNEEGEVIGKKEIKPPISSKTITQIDYLAFLIGLRQMLDNSLTYSLKCPNHDCQHEFEYTLNLEDEFNEEIFEFKPQHFKVNIADPDTTFVWTFELENFSMYDYLHFRYMMKKIEQADGENPDILYETRFTKPILYIKNIYINDEMIEDWVDLSLPDKLMFYNKIPPKVLFNLVGSTWKKDPEQVALCDFIEENFIEEKLNLKIYNLMIRCPKCENEIRGAFNFDNFFMS